MFSIPLGFHHSQASANSRSDPSPPLPHHVCHILLETHCLKCLGLSCPARHDSSGEGWACRLRFPMKPWETVLRNPHSELLDRVRALPHHKLADVLVPIKYGGSLSFITCGGSPPQQETSIMLEAHHHDHLLRTGWPQPARWLRLQVVPIRPGCRPCY